MGIPKAFPGGAEDPAWKTVRKLVELIVAAREPLPRGMARAALDWDTPRLAQAEEVLGLLFPVQEECFRARRPELLEQLTAGGAIWLRGFDLMKTKEGFASFYEQLELEPCQDPLASVGARAVVDKKSAMYEAVNKPSRAKFFVGMHAESTYKRTNRLGAFVCFKQAETGGEFLLLDGHKMLKARSDTSETLPRHLRDTS